MEGYILRDFRKAHWKIRKKSQPIYFVLLSNQKVIIDTEWDAMKRARLSGKAVIEMMLIKDRKQPERRDLFLNKLLEDNGQSKTQEL